MKSNGNKRPEHGSREADALWALYEELKKWKLVAERLEVNSGLVWQVAHGRTKSPKVARALHAVSPEGRFMQIIRQVALPWLREREKANGRSQETSL